MSELKGEPTRGVQALDGRELVLDCDSVKLLAERLPY